MTTFPSVTGKDWLLALKKAGFSWVRVKGSHHIFRNTPTGVQLLSLFMLAKQKGLISKILHNCELTST